MVVSMPKYDFGIKPIKMPSVYATKKSKKKRQLTNAQKLWCWENNPHICNICRRRVTKLSDAEFDHARAYSKGGATGLTNVKIAHRQCNRLKGSKSLSATQKMLGVKSKKKRKKTTRRKKKSNSPYEFKLPKYKPPKFKW
jgi:5-methylcytosine-specific restriction endonuclease McrA